MANQGGTLALVVSGKEIPQVVGKTHKWIVRHQRTHPKQSVLFSERGQGFKVPGFR